MSTGGIPVVVPNQVPLPRRRPSAIGPLASSSGRGGVIGPVAAAPSAPPAVPPPSTGAGPSLPSLGGVGNYLGDVAGGITAVTPYSSPISAFAEGFAGAQKSRLAREDRAEEKADKQTERDREAKADERDDERFQMAKEDRSYSRAQDKTAAESAAEKRRQDLENQVAERTTQYATATKPKQSDYIPLSPEDKEAWLADVDRFRRDLRRRLGLPADQPVGAEGGPPAAGAAQQGAPGKGDSESLLGTSGEPQLTDTGQVATGQETQMGQGQPRGVKPQSLKGRGKSPDDYVPMPPGGWTKQSLDAQVPVGAWYELPNGTVVPRAR